MCVDKFLFGDTEKCEEKLNLKDGHDAPIPETLGGEEDVSKATKAVTANIKKISRGF